MADLDGLLEMDAEQLLELNMVPGITLATVPPLTSVGPNRKTTQVTTLKIIPYAVRGRGLEAGGAVEGAKAVVDEVKDFVSAAIVDNKKLRQREVKILESRKAQIGAK